MRNFLKFQWSHGPRGARRAEWEALDAWLDRRYERSAPIEPLLEMFSRAGLGIAEVESMLRGGRANYPEAPQKAGALTEGLALDCLHVDHSVNYHIYVPGDYDSARAWPMVVVAHGGSAGRDLEFGSEAAIHSIDPFWIEEAGRHGLILVAPITDRGWGAIGYSILFSTISKVTRDYHVDPDRVHLTGHSMGGHLAWRCGINFGDRWGAISPMSGGYDYVKDKQVHNLCNVPGYATWGEDEPYQIREFNRAIRDWMDRHGYSWRQHEEARGGHEIFPDQIPGIARFFQEHPRDLYRNSVQARGGGAMEFNIPDAHPNWGMAHTWRSGRGIPAGTFHWLRLMPAAPGTSGDMDGQEVQAVNEGNNAFTVTSLNARRIRLYLHPRMVDISKNVVVTANHRIIFDSRVAPDIRTMLELAREFDDRGRIFQAAIDVEIEDDREVPEPTFA